MKQTIKKQYMKERRRIQSFIRSATKRGYIIPSDILPNIPKSVTRASINRLKKITPKKIYEKSEYVSRETGEIVSGERGRWEERKKATEKARQTRQKKKEVYSPPRESDIILSNLIETFNNFVPSRDQSQYMQQQKYNDRNIAIGILMDTIDELGEEKVINNIKNSSRLGDIINEILYSSKRDEVKFALVEFATIVRGESLSVDENINLTEMQEEI